MTLRSKNPNIDNETRQRRGEQSGACAPDGSNQKHYGIKNDKWRQLGEFPDEPTPHEECRSNPQRSQNVMPPRSKKGSSAHGPQFSINDSIYPDL